MDTKKLYEFIKDYSELIPACLSYKENEETGREGWHVNNIFMNNINVIIPILKSHIETEIDSFKDSNSSSLDRTIRTVHGSIIQNIPDVPFNELSKSWSIKVDNFTNYACHINICIKSKEDVNNEGQDINIKTPLFQTEIEALIEGYIKLKKEIKNYHEYVKSFNQKYNEMIEKKKAQPDEYEDTLDYIKKSVKKINKFNEIEKDMYKNPWFKPSRISYKFTTPQTSISDNSEFFRNSTYTYPGESSDMSIISDNTSDYKYFVSELPELPDYNEVISSEEVSPSKDLSIDDLIVGEIKTSDINISNILDYKNDTIIEDVKRRDL